MIRMLVLGDTHIPDRAYEIPKNILSFLNREKPFDIVAFTGDLTEKYVLEFVRGLGRKIYCVSGNMDYLPLPEYEVFEVNNIKIGLIHGDQVYPRGDIAKLTRIARNLEVHVLISGHTHEPFITVHKGILHLNPGSATGVPSGSGRAAPPSFMLIKILTDGLLEIHFYELIDKELMLKHRESIKFSV